MSKSCWGSLIAIALLAGPAVAADLPLKAPPLPVAVYNWTGCYVGLNAGWKGGRFRDRADAPGGTAVIPGVPRTTFPDDHIDLGSLDTDSAAGGGQIGCRWETASHWVFGVEADADATDLHGTITQRTLSTTNNTFVPGDTYDNRSRWEASFKGIIGRSFGQWLLYGTGGLAVANVSMGANYPTVVVNGLPFPASAGSQSKTLTGFTVGAGAAYAITNNLDIGAEYRYSQYTGSDFGLGSVAGFCAFTTAIPGQTFGCTNTTVTGHKDLTTNEVLFRINYKFNPTAVVAKY
jgi:outer membrane immunogenic protein